MWEFYNDIFPTFSVPELFNQAMNDFTFRQPSIMLAERHALHQPTYMYDLRWISPVQDGAMGAGHTIGIGMFLYNLWTPSTPFQLGPSPPVKLSQSFSEAVANFMHDGAPKPPVYPTTSVRQH